MIDADDLIARVQAGPASDSLLYELAAAYIAETTTAAQRGAMRAAVASPELKAAYETLYFDGAGIEDPPHFVRHTLAALFLTGGYGDPETARRVADELRLFAAHHQVDYQAHLAAIRALPGVRPGRTRRLRFVLGMGALVAALIVGTLAVQFMPESWRIVLQIALLLGVMGGQMALLYWYFRTR